MSVDKQILAARKQLWKLGELEWKLDTTQKKIYEFFHECQKKVIVVNASRRLGKSFSLVVFAMEECLKNPKSIVKFLQPKQNMIRINITPIFNTLLEDCPKDLRPHFNGKDNIYEFPNGSQIQLAGTDNGNAEKIRGGNAHLCIVDEAGFCSDLNYLVNSILIPTTTLTQGKIILSSTTPPNSEHEFIEYMRIAGAQDSLIVKTIYDALEDHKTEESPRITTHLINEIISNTPGGEKSDSFQTEYLCKILNKSQSSVIPEFDDEIIQDTVVDWPRPDFCDKYVAMDIGHIDFTFVLFAYYDFSNAVIVIEDELCINGPTMTTESLSNDIKNKEKTLWYNKKTAQYDEPLIRVSDNNLIMINDLIRLHKLVFIPTQKDNKEAQISQLRILIQNRQVIINPRCKILIEHLKHATWDKSRKDFKRSEAYGHYDGIDALVYLVRNIDRNRNPYPKGYKFANLSRDEWFVADDYKDANNKQKLSEWAVSLMPRTSKNKKLRN